MKNKIIFFSSVLIIGFIMILAYNNKYHIKANKDYVIKNYDRIVGNTDRLNFSESIISVEKVLDIGKKRFIIITSEGHKEYINVIELIKGLNGKYKPNSIRYTNKSRTGYVVEVNKTKYILYAGMNNYSKKISKIEFVRDKEKIDFNIEGKYYLIKVQGNLNGYVDDYDQINLLDSNGERVNEIIKEENSNRIKYVVDDLIYMR